MDNSPNGSLDVDNAGIADGQRGNINLSALLEDSIHSKNNKSK
jgi:hypothetical protein